MQVITGNHFFQEFSGRNNVRSEDDHHNKSNKHHDSLASHHNKSLSLQFQEKTETIHYAQNSQNDNDDVNTDVSFKAETSSLSLSFNGGLEDSNRLLFNSISQKLEGFETKNNGSQFNFEYSSNSTEISFANTEDTSNLLISKITQIALSFSSLTSSNDDVGHHETASETALPLPSNTPAQTTLSNENIVQTPVIQDPETTPATNTETDKPVIPVSIANTNPTPSSPKNNIDNIRTAVDAGFQETTRAIQDFGSFTKNISDAFAEIRQRLDDLLNSLSQPAPTSINANYFKYDASSETSIQIRTQDGDIVNIQFSNSSHQEYFNGSIENGQTAANDTTYQNSSDSHYAFSVEGDLDEEELAAIEKLVTGIQEITKSHSQNDISAAFSTLNNINFDTSELQAYQFESKTVEEFKAVSLYQQLASDETREHTSANTPVSNTFDLAMGSILELLAKARENNITEPVTTIRELIEKFSKQADTAKEQTVEALPQEQQVINESLNLVA